ncbi:MAG: hypothetical protein JNL97_15235, partial [Verrucomicrobiales bacterium]|nr:hypothetical protein [Verrucomicrobiales bacterium]
MKLARWYRRVRGLFAGRGAMGLLAVLAGIVFGERGGTMARGATLDWRWSHPVPHGNNIVDLVFRSGRYVQVTDHGGVYVSTNRVAWERRATGTSKDLRAVAFFGDRLLVVGEEGTVLWSDDGSVFAAGTVTPATTDWLEGVATSDTRAIAVGDNGAIYRSNDGMNWARTATGAFTEWWTGVAWGAGVFVAVGDDGLVATSPDGDSWTRRRSGVTATLTRVVYGDNRFLAVGESGVVVTSVNGTNWTVEASIGSTNDLATAALSPGERFVAGESAMALRRTVGVWQDQLSAEISPSPAPEWNYAASVWDGARYLVAGRTGVIVESFRTNLTSFENATFWLRQDD